MKKIFFAVLLCLSSVFVKGQNLNIVPVPIPCFGLTNGSLQIDVVSATNYTLSISSMQIITGTGNGTNVNTHFVNGLAAGTYTVVLTDANIASTSAVAVITQPVNLAVSISAIAPNCQNNGSATAFAIGGIPPYTYVWSPSGQTTPTVANMPSGSYGVMVMDANGCASTSSVVIPLFNPPMQVSTSNNIPDTCNQGVGSFCINVASGVPPFSYTLNGLPSTACPSALLGGNYLIEVTDANGCSKSTVVNVVQSNLAVNISATSPQICLGQTATLTASGDPATYVWDFPLGQFNPQVIAPIATQNYVVTATDGNGCTASSNFNLVVNPLPNISIFSNLNQICVGSSATLTASGATNYTWSFPFSTGNAKIVSPASNSIYSVVGTDANGCSSTATFNLAVNALPIINVLANPSQIAVGNTTTLTASGGSNYLWNNGLPPVNPQVFTPLAIGQYFFIVTGVDANGCTATSSAMLTVTGFQTSFNNIIPDTCNQGQGAFCISITNGTAPFSYTLNGQPITSCPVGLNSGTYTVVVTDATGQSVITIVTIPNYSLFSMALTVQDDWCTLGSATISANISGSATNPVTYTNSYNSSALNSFTTTSGNQYFMTATDANGCTAQGSISVTKKDSFYASINSGVFCNDTLLIGPSANFWNGITYTGYTPLGSSLLYSANTGISVPAIMTYTIVSNNLGFYCNDTTLITLLPNTPSSTLVSASNINPSCSNALDGNITVITNPFSPNASYGLIGNNYSIQQQSSTPLFSNLGPGTYSINVRDSSGCNQISTTLTSLNSNCGNISGHVVIDTNSNCNFDAGEATNANRMVVLNPGNHITYTNASGAYVFPSLSYGNYTIQTNAAPGYIPICSATSAAVVSNTNSNIIINRYDSIAPLVNYSIWSWGGCLSPALAVWMPNAIKRNINYSLYHTPNIGGTARIYAVFDSVQYFGSSLPTHSGISGDTVYWDLPIGSNGNIEVTFSYPPNSQAGPGQNINYYVTQHPLDSNLANNFSPTTITICTSYDPNDKQVNPQGATSNGFTALNDSVLNYKVRFQNTGNAPAGNVIIRDTLDSDLDITSFSVISASHSYQIEVEQNHILVFKFLGIMLPDSASDQEGSNGYIAYTIKKKPGTLPGDIVSNTAHIYFDYNAPIITNTTTNTYYESIKNASIQITKNTNCSNVCGNGSVLINAQGGAGTLTYSILPNCSSTQISGNLIAPLPSGNFTVQVKDQAGNIENLPITIGSPTPINLSINTTNASGANGGSAQANVSGGTTPYAYNWSASGCSGATCNNLNVGTYTLSILDAEGCGTSSNFTISFPTSVQQINFENSIQLFPNPTKDILFVTGTNNLGSISISNQMGQIIWSANLNTNETQISTAGWANGVYYLRNGGRVYKVSVQD